VVKGQTNWATYSGLVQDMLWPQKLSINLVPDNQRTLSEAEKASVLTEVLLLTQT